MSLGYFICSKLNFKSIRQVNILKIKIKIKMKANCLLAALFVHFYGMMQPDSNAYVLVNGWKLARAANESLPLLLFLVNSSTF
jgi:hypothetical protein